MLGRYTPAALECASMTRMQAMRGAAGILEPEHLAMALLHASPTLFDWLTAQEVEEVRRAVNPGAPAADACGIVMSGGTGAGGLPPGPSEALRRVIERSGEDADRLRHRRIAPEHLLSALLGEPGVPAVEALAARGITRDRVLHDMTAGRVIRAVEPPSREALTERMLEWIGRLSDEALGPIEMMIDAAQRHGTPGASGHLPATESGRPLSEQPPWGLTLPKAFTDRMPLRAGSRTSSRTEGGVHVFTSRRTIRGQEITTVERFRPSDDGLTIAYSQEVRGPGHASERQIEFQVAPDP
jgi:hypothetical protein